MKDYIGWAIALGTTVLIWKLHTTLHKGLLQLWRYAKGHTEFSGPTAPAPAPEEPPRTAVAAR